MEYVSEDVERTLRYRGHEVKLGKVKIGDRVSIREGKCKKCGSKVHIEVAFEGGSLRVFGKAETTTCQEVIDALSPPSSSK